MRAPRDSVVVVVVYVVVVVVVVGGVGGGGGGGGGGDICAISRSLSPHRTAATHPPTTKHENTISGC